MMWKAGGQIGVAKPATKGNHMRVSDILGRGSKTATAKPTDTVGRAVEILREHGFGALVVSDNGRSIDGIVSERDIVRALGVTEGLLELPVADIMTRKVFTRAQRSDRRADEHYDPETYPPSSRRHRR